MECHTNRIEGAWKHCKDHYRRINGTNTKLFEQQMGEMVWRNHIYNGNKSAKFFELVKRTYPLNEDKKLTYSTPLFKMWTPTNSIIPETVVRAPLSPMRKKLHHLYSDIPKRKTQLI